MTIKDDVRSAIYRKVYGESAIVGAILAGIALIVMFTLDDDYWQTFATGVFYVSTARILGALIHLERYTGEKPSV